ncbi:DJ-1 domain InhA-type [Penicillium paradoxum]|uniref:DJ-1 domain InhA-type n=1 Tax=Penicillium paradoxum TaxID=176176 RepID=UPI002546C035|nr:DJ-1 domain InhA-type [Penicillium paradoxum]KAJ5773405.1 DJ-1 domain InhA-type [Penicillium paradoxum]
MNHIQKGALVVIFPGFNILDVSGPVSVLYNSDFSVTFAAKDELTVSQENTTVQRNISFAEAKPRLSDWEILIVPGSRPNNILPLVQPEDGPRAEIVEFIASFASDVNHESIRQRTILSVSLGAYFLASGGVLDGLIATTHRLAVPGLRTVVERYVEQTPGAKRTRVVPENSSDSVPYLDGGRNQVGVKVITTGASVYGLDAALYFVSLASSRALAIEVAELLGHPWKEI